MSSKLNDKPIVIIGGGPAGYKSALEIRKQFAEQEIIVIEKFKLGGTCLHVGCIPSKQLHTIKSLDDFPKMIRKNKMILEKGIASEFKTSNIEFINDEAKLEIKDGKDANNLRAEDLVVKAGDRVIEFTQLVIASGSKPRSLKDYPEALTSDSFFSEENIKAP